jgi:hypothetical protein
VARPRVLQCGAAGRMRCEVSSIEQTLDEAFWMPWRLPVIASASTVLLRRQGPRGARSPDRQCARVSAAAPADYYRRRAARNAGFRAHMTWPALRGFLRPEPQACWVTLPGRLRHYPTTLDRVAAALHRPER